MKSLHWVLVLPLAAFAFPAPGSPSQKEKSAGGKYSIDGTHSSVIFSIQHFNVAKFYGSFKELSGSIHYDGAKLDSCSIDMSIAADSVDTRNEGRDKHVKSQDFLSAKEFPSITFKSKSVKAAPGGKLELTGDFTLHGVTKPLTVQVEKTGEADTPKGPKIGFEARFQIKRSDFGMKFMQGPLGDDIDMIVSIEANAVGGKG